MALLIIRRPGWPEEHLTLDGPALIGRGQACTVQLTDPAVSTHHCRIEPVEEFWQITDLKSRTGTFVGDKQITTQYLKDIDTIRIAGMELEFHSQSEEDDTPNFERLGEPVSATATVDISTTTYKAAAKASPRSAAKSPTQIAATNRKTIIKLSIAAAAVLIGGFLIFSEVSGDSSKATPSVAHAITQQLPGD